jgi:hypothetical protein
MDNKYLYMVLGGVSLFAWYWVGHQPHYAEGETLSLAYKVAAILALAMGAGNSDGTCAVTTPVNAVKGFINSLVCLTVAFVATNLMYQLLVSADAFNAMLIVNSISTVIASAVLMTVTMSYLKKGAA